MWNFLHVNKRQDGRRGETKEKGRKEGPDSLALVWPRGTKNVKTQTCREPAVETEGGNGKVGEHHLLCPGSQGRFLSGH